MRIVSRHPARVIMVLAVAAVLALPGSTVAQRKFQLRVRPAAHHGLRHRRRRLRTIGYPWLSLQQATTGFFAYGVFIGMAAATRRRDHLFLSEITKRLPTTTRTAVEVFDRLVVLGVALAMVWFGCKNFLLDLGSFRMPSMIPLGTYTIIVPVSGALIALFAVEQAVNGWRNGFAGPDDRDDEPRVIV